jgi:hypothetical protein
MMRHVDKSDVAETRAGVVLGGSMIDSGVAKTRRTKVGAFIIMDIEVTVTT